MRTLEDELGYELFDRSNRLTKISEAGRIILPRAEQLIMLYEELSTAIAKPDEVVGTITIGSVVSAMGHVAYVVSKLKLAYPRLNAHLVTGKSITLVEQVVAGEIDAAILVGSPEKLHGSLRWSELYEEQMVIIASTMTGGESAATLLTSRPFLRFERIQRTGLLIDRILRKRQIHVREFLELNSVDTIVELVRQNVGVAIVPRLRHTSWDTDPMLRVLRISGNTPRRIIGMLERKAHGRSPVTTTILEHLLNA